MGGLRLRIDQLGCCGEGYGCRLRIDRPARRCRRLALPFFDWNGILSLISYDTRGAQSSLGFSSSSITRFSKRLAPPPSMLR